MKKTTLFSLLTMLFLFVGSNVWADEEPFYTLLTVSNTTGSNHTSYTDYFDDEHDGMVWNAPGNQKVNDNTMDRWRIGGKALENVDRTITAKTAMGSAINRVVLNHFGVSRNEVTVNSLKLTIASDVEYTTILDEVTLTPTIAKGEAGSEEFMPTTTYGTEWPTGVYYKLTINLSNTSTSNGGLDIASIQFFAPGGGVTVAKPVITPSGGTFSEPQEVTITAGEGCTVYYTIDGENPTDASTLYEAPFTVSEDCTVKAIAYDGDDNASSIASAVFKFAHTYTTIAALCAAATSSDTPAIVEFNNWIVTGKTSNNVYFTDGVNGILLYQSGHGFEVGDILTGSAQITLTMYNEAPEIKGLTATTEGVTVTKGEGATPRTDVAIADIESNMQGCLITLEGVTYSEGKFVDDDDNTITPYNTFVALPSLIEGKTYNVTGVVIWYLPNNGSGYWEIAPRTADEIELLTTQIAPESSWSVEEEVVDVNETPTAVFTTNSDGVVTYESSNEDVATIDENGVITPVGKGTTTITANVAETETYLPDSKSFTLKVTVEGYLDATFKYNDADIEGQGASEVGAELTATRNEVLDLYANKAYAKPEDTHIKIYGSKYEGSEEEGNRTLTEPSYIKLSVAVPYVITKIVMTATGESYIKEWKDQFGTEAVISGTTATWEGVQADVILTNLSTAQARIKTIEVTYANTDIVTAISTPTSVQSETAIYNLAGQRLSKMQKGINIVGGKKILK